MPELNDTPRFSDPAGQHASFKGTSGVQSEVGLISQDALMCLTPDPLGLIDEEHALQRELCDLLEAIADSLPHDFDRELAMTAVSILERSVPSHMAIEEQALFPRLRERVPLDDPLRRALECLEEEHERDGMMLFEMIDSLKCAIEELQISNPDMLGYQLRGFFESQRRHIAWEDRVVLPAARALLDPTDLAAIQRWIIDSDHPRCSQRSILAIRKVRSASHICADCPSLATRSAAIPTPQDVTRLSIDKPMDLP
jgi:hemerythrin-like domain-containing protein